MKLQCQNPQALSYAEKLCEILKICNNYISYHISYFHSVDPLQDYKIHMDIEIVIFAVQVRK